MNNHHLHRRWFKIDKKVTLTKILRHSETEFRHDLHSLNGGGADEKITIQLALKGDWLKETGFDTGRGVTVKIPQGCIVLMAD
jgi:toxic protein SymE